MTSNIELEHGANVVENWLSTMDADDMELPTQRTDAEDLLWDLSARACEGASHADLAEAVAEARGAGWDWPPIAALLAMSRDDAIRRFGGESEQQRPGVLARLIPAMRQPTR